MQFCFEDGNFLVGRDFYKTNATTAENISANSRSMETSLPTISFSPPHYRQETQKKSKRNLQIGLLSLLAIMSLFGGGFIWAAINVVVTKRAAAAAAQANESAFDAPKLGNDEMQENHVAGAEKKEKSDDSPKSDDLKKSSSNAPTKTTKSIQFNGRVVMLNAVLRAAPMMEADQTEVLPLDEPLKIGQRASPNSPWYRVVAASGAKGWMHGNTIEFN